MKKLNYGNDPLISNKKIFVNGCLNVYGALVRKSDMKNNKKGEVLKKCPYLIDEKDTMQKILRKLKDKNFIKIRGELSEYLKIKNIRKDTFDNWLRKRIYPLPLVRIICSLYNKDMSKILKNASITNFCKSSKIKIPSSNEEITTDFMAYFLGLHLGDGTLNEERWKIVDGDMNKENLRYSYDFLYKIKSKIENIFSIKSSKIHKIKNKNAYELVIANRWFGRYLNFVYGVEQKQKENPKIPEVLKNKKDLVLRGLFDTDGSIKDYRVSVGTRYDDIYKELCKILRKHKIEYKEKRNNIQRKNVVYISEIKKGFISNFIKEVGFSHPRKMGEARKYLLTNSSSRNFIEYKKEYRPKISEDDFIELCNFIRPIRNAGKVRFISEFNKLSPNKKKKIIKNFKKNFEISKNPNKHGYIYSYNIERTLTNYCLYTKKRKQTSKEEINKLLRELNNIWN